MGDAARDLSARVIWHELMLAMLVAMQALDLFYTRGDSMSAILLFGFAVLAGVLWLRWMWIYGGGAVRDFIGSNGVDS